MCDLSSVAWGRLENLPSNGDEWWSGSPVLSGQPRPCDTHRKRSGQHQPRFILFLGTPQHPALWFGCSEQLIGLRRRRSPCPGSARWVNMRTQWRLWALSGIIRAPAGLLGFLHVVMVLVVFQSGTLRARSLNCCVWILRPQGASVRSPSLFEVYFGLK